MPVPGVNEKMKKVLILATKWQSDYWESDKEAPYPDKKYTELPEWNNLSKSCPLPGIGRYFHPDKKDFSDNPFVYLIIMGFRYDPDGQPYFNFKSLVRSETKSGTLEGSLPQGNRKLFSAIEQEKMVKILKEFNEKPPKEWRELIEIEKEITHWKDYIGKYFLDIETVNLGNDEFEDRNFNLLRSLGFDVDQKGDTLPGEYADGIFSIDEYAVVYDCKNTSNFFPSAADKRAVGKYLNDEKKLRKEINVYPAFIAKSFAQGNPGDFFCLTVNSLNSLLYKKLLLGSKFILNPVKKILENKTPLTEEIIDKEWRA